MKRNSKKLKRALTLIEMIVVLMLLTMITGALAYNYKGSLDTGKKFERKEMLSSINTILEIALAQGDIQSQNDADNWANIITKSPLVKNSADTIAKAQAIGFQVQYIQSGNSSATLTTTPKE